MCKSFLLVILLSTLPCAQAHLKAFKVNNVPISVQAQEKIVEQLKVLHPQMKSDELESTAKHFAIEQAVVYQEALKNKLDKELTIATQLDEAKRTILVSAQAEKFVKDAKVSDKDIRSEYDRLKALYGPKEYQFRHLLVPNEKIASSLIDKLQKGDDFSEVSAGIPSNPKVGSSKGLTEWLSPAFMSKKLAEEIKKYKVGQLIPHPIETPFGWEIMKIEAVRNTQDYPTFEKQKDSIRQNLAIVKAKKTVTELIQKAKITD